MTHDYRKKSVTERKPRRPLPDDEFARSYAECGIWAQKDSLIELRAPDPDKPRSSAWPRIWLTRRAAERLHHWLGEAIVFKSRGDL